MKKIVLTVIVLVLVPCSLLAQESNVGVLQGEFTTPEGKILKGLIWYPTDDISNEPFTYWNSYKKSQSILNASIAQRSEKFPVIVFTHGLGMCSFQSIFLTEYLASQGYVVIALDHSDANYCGIDEGVNASLNNMATAYLKGFGDFNKTVELAFHDSLPYLKDPAFRPQEVSFALDVLYAHPQFMNIIERTRVAVVGHSFGAWTSLAIAGAEIDCRSPES